jgi:hypothetical protein
MLIVKPFFPISKSLPCGQFCFPSHIPTVAYVSDFVWSIISEAHWANTVRNNMSIAAVYAILCRRNLCASLSPRRCH